MLGFVKRLNSKEGKSKKNGKAFTAWSMIMENADGAESGWISLGFERPSFGEGTWANYESNPGKFGLELVKFEVAEAPAKPAPQVGSTGAPTKGAYVDRNDSIVYQSSRKDALALTGLLLEHNGLPMSAAATKAGQAARYEEITAFVDKLTVEFFHDVQSGRVLREVVDAGAGREDAPAASGGASEADND